MRNFYIILLLFRFKHSALITLRVETLLFTFFFRTESVIITSTAAIHENFTHTVFPVIEIFGGKIITAAAVFVQETNIYRLYTKTVHEMFFIIFMIIF